MAIVGMHLHASVLVTVTLLVMCAQTNGRSRGGHSEIKPLKHHHKHHGHRMDQGQGISPPPYATWEGKADRQSVKPQKKPFQKKENAGEMRGVYIVVELDESPPPYKRKAHRDKRDTITTDPDGGDDSELAPTITELSVNSEITNRFATTNMKSVISNAAEEDREARFVVQLPEKAFISNFTMVINDKLLIGQVKAKEEADKAYEEARKRNETAGKVSNQPRSAVQPSRGMEVFTVVVNVAATSSAEFELTYQQLLERKLGFYEHMISIRPNQVVKDLRVAVNLRDSQDIKFVNVSMNGREPIGQAAIENVNSHTRKITYIPDEQSQITVDKDTGLNGELKVMYDVVHAPNDAGMVCVDGDYFIHYFSPTGLDPLNKNVVFVIDISGSMAGSKIEQTLTAMKAILDILRSGDLFKLILFHSALVHWPSEQALIPASVDNIYKAKQFLDDHLKASGSTNINDALVEACRTLTKSGENVWGSNIIVFLTDGQPTAGERVPEQIVKNVVKEAANKVSVFSLGFGNKYELDFDLLKKISYRTGVAEGAIRIYPGLEADEQLKTFFNLVNTPLLYNIKIEYPIDIVIIDSVTQTDFPQYFEGSELVVAGKINPNHGLEKMSLEVAGATTMEIKYQKDIDLSSSCSVVSRGYAQRLYAYMKIKYLLIQADKTDSKSVIDQIKQDALQLALEYNLVTPLTSMVVVQQTPDEDDFYSEEDYRGRSVLTAKSSVYSATPSLNNNISRTLTLITAALVLLVARTQC